MFSFTLTPLDFLKINQGCLHSYVFLSFKDKKLEDKNLTQKNLSRGKSMFISGSLKIFVLIPFFLKTFPLENRKIGKLIKKVQLQNYRLSSASGFTKLC